MCIRDSRRALHVQAQRRGEHLRLRRDTEQVELDQRRVDLLQAAGPQPQQVALREVLVRLPGCLLYTSDAADDLLCVDFGCRRLIKKKKHNH